MYSPPEFVEAPLLGVTVTPMTAADVVAHVSQRSQSAALLLNHNLHSVYIFHTDARFRDLYSRAAVVLIDGWPVLRALQGPRLDASYRIGSTDWFQNLWSVGKGVVPDGYRVFLLGATAESNAAGVERFRREMPGAVVAGRDGFFGEEDEAEVVDSIQQFRPDLVLLGMGMPQQEYFLLRNLSHLPPAHYATVGGAIDYIGGHQILAPRILGKLGLEWLWRFAHAPRRLFHRYFIEPFALAWVLLRRKWTRASPPQQ